MTQLIQNEIIRTLAQAEGHPLLQDVLVLQVQSRVRPRPSQEQTSTAISKLVSVGFILSMPNELDAENPYWLLDEKGSAFAHKNRLL